MSLEIKPTSGFDWAKVTWGRPDSVVSALCSYCSAAIAEDDVPLRVWTPKGFAAQFCTACLEKGSISRSAWTNER